MKWGNAFRIYMQMRDVAQVVRDMSGDDVLGYVGLQRKRSAFTTYVLPGLGFFAAGLAAGAGIGLLFAPSSGRELRGQIGHKYEQVKDKVSATTQQLREQATAAGQQMADTVQSGVKDVSEEVSSGGQGRYI